MLVNMRLKALMIQRRRGRVKPLCAASVRPFSLSLRFYRPREGQIRDANVRLESADRQLAPRSLHDVLQVTVLPFMHTLHTSTHWLSCLAS